MQVGKALQNVLEQYLGGGNDLSVTVGKGSFEMRVVDDDANNSAAFRKAITRGSAFKAPRRSWDRVPPSIDLEFRFTKSGVWW